MYNVTRKFSRIDFSLIFRFHIKRFINSIKFRNDTFVYSSQNHIMRIFLLFLSFLMLFSCDYFKEKSSSTRPIKIIRFDLDLKDFDTKNFDASDATLYKKYGDLYTFYIEGLMGIGKQNPKSDELYYQKFFPKFHDGEYVAMMDTFEKRIFPKIPEIENQLGSAYANLNKEFPEKKPSNVFSFFISPQGANPQAAFSYGNDTIGFNWFNYLGKDFSLYEPFYAGYTYMLEWNSSEYIPRNIMLVEYNLLKEKYPSSESSDQLIHQMIEEGKKFYFLDKVCPDMKDWTKIGYSEKQYMWCEENQMEAWSYFIENKLLYSVEAMDAKKYTQEGPTTSGMPSESPGMVGTWIGWQIVKKYADVSGKNLKEILKTSPREIMAKANYKPKK